MRMARYWMTESMATVMMASDRARSRTNAQDPSKYTLSRASRYSVKTTAGRIQQAARDSGFGVFASMDGFCQPDIAERILVLADASGGTPVIQDAWPDSEFGLPLEVRITEQQDGTSIVTIIDSTLLEEHRQALPQDVAQSLSQLPRLIEVALAPEDADSRD